MDYIKLATDIDQMSKGELSAVTTISGLIIVFGMLLLLVLIISIFGLVSKTAKKSASGSEKKAETPVKNTAVKPSAPVNAAQSNDDDEVIAVISAAVAMMYEGTGKTAVIRSIKPASNARTAWAAAGIRDNVRAF